MKLSFINTCRSLFRTKYCMSRRRVLYQNDTTPMDPKFCFRMLGGDMWCLETLQNSMAYSSLFSTPGVTLIMIHCFVVLPQSCCPMESRGGRTANKEATIDALRPGESERRLQYDLWLVVTLYCRCRNPTRAFIQNEKGNLKSGREFFAKIGDLEKCNGSIMPWIAHAAGRSMVVVDVVGQESEQIRNAIQDHNRNGRMLAKQSRQTRSEKFHQFLGVANPMKQNACQTILYCIGVSVGIRLWLGMTVSPS